ncbi:MAG: XRE family transcriptional regulator [Candidatus Deferrimicrobiaceae bacterium]
MVYVGAINVGKRIKSIRKRKNLTLQEVSENSGMSATAISAIERNVSSPTVNTLVAIGRALGESLTSLLGENEIEYVVTRAGTRKRLASDMRNVEFQTLAGGVPGRRFHPVLNIIRQETSNGEDFINRPEDDFLFVIEGTLDVEMDGAGTSIRLEKGDSVYLRGSTPYRWRNPSGQEETQLLVVSTS